MAGPKRHSPGFERLCDAARARITEISVHEAARAAAEPGTLLVDVREDREWAAGRASGAIHMSRGVIERDIEERVPDPATRLVCYCGGGYRSALVAESLARMGYLNVLSVAGGWRAWHEAGLPIDGG
jgi:rhodanese-related sulfurtransferase